MTDPLPVLKIISPRRNLVVIAVVCALFTAMGIVVLMLAPTKTTNLVVGTLAVGFFGVGGGWSLATQWRRSVLLRADDRGIHLGAGGDIPWGDIERIGSTQTALGIRLRRYDAFLGTVPRGTEHTPQTLRASRSANAGWDLLWERRLLDRTPGEAARDLQRRRHAA